MLKLFRIIRQNLLKEGKTKKYFKYAIGEIILVVIGIMIAIQLNNFNQHRNNTKNGVILLDKLHQEIDIDIKYFDSLSSDYNRWFTQTKFILDSVLSGKIIKLERLEQYNVGRGSMNFLHLNRSSYNEMLNTGNNIEIENLDLKNKIISFFQKAEIELNKLNFDNEMFHRWIYDNLDVTLWHRLWSNHNLDYEDWQWLQDPSSDKFRTLEGYVLFFQNAIKANLEAIQVVRSNCQSMNELIKKELNKKRRRGEVQK